MSIRSGKGDLGMTDLLFRRRVKKDSLDVRAMGELDELNAYIGLVRAKLRTKKDKANLEKIQRAIYSIASEVAVGIEKKKKFGPLLNKNDADWIEKLVYQLEKKVELDSCFYMPGDSELSAYIDITRAVARRAERSIVELFRKEKIKNDCILSFLNCVSDVLFVMARVKTNTPSTLKRGVPFCKPQIPDKNIRE